LQDASQFIEGDPHAAYEEQAGAGKVACQKAVDDGEPEIARRPCGSEYHREAPQKGFLYEQAKQEYTADE
jgi:hypothetical protein